MAMPPTQPYQRELGDTAWPVLSRRHSACKEWPSQTTTDQWHQCDVCPAWFASCANKFAILIRTVPSKDSCDDALLSLCSEKEPCDVALKQSCFYYSYSVGFFFLFFLFIFLVVFQITDDIDQQCLVWQKHCQFLSRDQVWLVTFFLMDVVLLFVMI